MDSSSTHPAPPLETDQGPTMDELIERELEALTVEYLPKILGGDSKDPTRKRRLGIGVTQSDKVPLAYMKYSSQYETRNPGCQIGDRNFITGNFGLKETLQGLFTLFDKAIEIFENALHSTMKEHISQNPDALFLPPIEQQHLINSKVEYLRVLQSLGYISPDTLILFPFDREGNKIDFQDNEMGTKHFVELQECLSRLYKKKDDKGNDITGGRIYEAWPEKQPERAASYYWSKKLSVLKLPYAGGSGCVIYPYRVSLVEPNSRNDNNSYIWWLAVYLWAQFHGDENNHESPAHHLSWVSEKGRNFKCLGFTRGIIVDRYNPLISMIGEFRTFVFNGDVIAISFSSPKIKALEHLRGTPMEGAHKTPPLFFNGTYNEAVLEKVKESFINHPGPNISRFWDSTQSNQHNFNIIFLSEIKRLSKEVSDLLNLNCNRIDFVVHHGSLKRDTAFKLIVNEVEDITYGDGPTAGFNFGIPPSMTLPHGYLDMRDLQFDNLASTYPEKIAELKENQGLRLQLSASDAFKEGGALGRRHTRWRPVTEGGLDYSAEVPAVDVSAEAQGGGIRTKKRRKSKRRKPKRRKSKRRKSKK